VPTELPGRVLRDAEVPPEPPGRVLRDGEVPPEPPGRVLRDGEVLKRPVHAVAHTQVGVGFGIEYGGIVGHQLLGAVEE
jgi:hypothetical protein